MKLSEAAVCPSCSAPVPSATAMERGAEIEPGAPCICAYCLAFSVVTTIGTLRHPNAREGAEFAVDPYARMLVDTMRRRGYPLPRPSAP